MGKRSAGVFFVFVVPDINAVQQDWANLRGLQQHCIFRVTTL
jgi:hypothetical protein